MALMRRAKKVDEAELDITSFMNLMIVLVPVLLLSLTFTKVTVHDIQLPELTGGMSSSERAQSQLEVEVDGEGFKVYYPGNTLIKAVPLQHLEAGESYDYAMLSSILQGMKLQLQERRDVIIKSSPSVSYQTLVSTMDTVKSYKTVLSASLVEVELFPEISLANL
ncbi:biopolymer transport protein ExbD [Sinobacterium caligoides]|uniref:Biopolymer transport protein ExbD n=1 Tax=Sinobacterium caligoides TaxID=933926 RepID=A0A3N2DPE6_9GAMM|nr:biopolymer transporter ExbD [Sinobacterium caligoides]ROS01195.1 biopolymer transport protein ExbD [Sinobacterium caligoides]